MAIIMPSVVPMTTKARLSKRAASAAVAISVLSPISAMKKLHRVARKAFRALSGTASEFVELVGDQRPDGHREKREAEHPAQHRAAEELADELSGNGGKGVIGQGRDENAAENGDRLAEARGEHHREKLRAVADLRDGDDEGRDEESFHFLLLGAGRYRTNGSDILRPARVMEIGAKGLAKRIDVDPAGRAMPFRRSGTRKSVDAAPSGCGRRLLPND